MTDTDQSYVRDEGGRGLEDMTAMQNARESGTCPFCQIIAGEKDDQPVLYETDCWAVFANIRPENGTELHITAAAKINPNHDSQLTFDGLSDEALHEFGPLVRDLASEWQIGKGRSVFMRIDPTGDDTASTVFHPCFHVVVSDGKPVDAKDISPAILAMLNKRRNDIQMAFREAQPELADKYAKEGEDKFWSESLKFLWENVALLRSFLTDKAVEIRPKFSNKAASPHKEE